MTNAIAKSIFIHIFIVGLILINTVFNGQENSKKPIKVTAISQQQLAIAINNPSPLNSKNLTAKNQTELKKRIATEIANNSQLISKPNKPSKPKIPKVKKIKSAKPKTTKTNKLAKPIKPKSSKTNNPQLAKSKIPKINKQEQQKLINLARVEKQAELEEEKRLRLQADITRRKLEQQRIDKIATNKKLAQEKEIKRQAWLAKVANRKTATQAAEKLGQENEIKRQAWLAKVAKRKAAKDLQRRQQEYNLIKQARLKATDNKINSGGNQDTTPTNSPTEQEELNAIIFKYSELIRRKMSAYWVRSLNSRTLELIASVGIRLKPDGSISRVRVIKSSGFTDFDASVLNALWRANILPVPKKPKYLALFTDGELEMDFKNF